ncbi:Transglutaminase-like enzyme, putative cysteine protease [Halogranum gelatinilyticum]|uniref:Transglutaminase-like enzyme, putative cysteine protease n=1 Tax=Halogranum gelatinilyticum TaxID=660521 RepID=A0A1G9XIW8_9EURY|nr:transglutaminaseTgpA domain-containing protein [Halogranum gelatinilyticum]SDM96759.1 Transglutaminase-like enzyme, putative cysteine protease [Halogranum gelatinilyticum]
MADRNPFSDVGGREYGRIALVCSCVVALVLAASLVPALAGDAPADSLVFVEGEGSGSDGVGSLDGAHRPQLGALNAANRTDVGGSLADDNGSLRSLSPEVHFTVRSTSAGYWRTGSYDRYTGSGWEQTGAVRPTDGRVDVAGLGDREVQYEVRLNRSATSLPTVWIPQRVDAGDADLLVTDGGAVRADEPVPAGTTYTGTSVRPPSDPDVLRTSGRDYPAAVETRYTRLPDSTPERLTTFTDELTAGARSPYEEAVRIERWLEANKTYSLDASHDGGDVADQFVFEMDAGYCEYFATTMTAMLRSQGVPARYVVGYSTGQATGENAYTVRGMNAHAWVEVYFADVGWVRFDPTPGSERLNAEQQAFEAAGESGSYDGVEEGSPGETFSANDSASGDESTNPPDGAENGTQNGTGTGSAADGTSGSGSEPTAGTPSGGGSAGDGDESESGSESSQSDGESDGDSSSENSVDDDADPSSGYAIDLNTTPVPGASVAVTVTNDGDPAERVEVFFNDASVGRTDANGTVVATVPYTENLTVSIGAADVERRAAVGSVPGVGILDDDRRFALSSDTTVVLQQDAAANESNTSRSYRLETNATLSVTGERVTGNDVLVTASVSGFPVRDAALTLDGEQVARTNRTGRARVTLPTQPGNVTLAVSRGAVSGRETLSLAELGVRVEPSLPLALPLQPVTVRATLGDRPAAGVNATVAGESVGRTDVDGTLRTDLPLADSAAITVQQYGQTARTGVSGLYLNALLVGLPPLALLAGVVVSAARRGVTARSVLRTLGFLVTRLVRHVLALLVGLAEAVDRLLRRTAVALRRALLALRSLVARRRSLSELLAALRAWLHASLTAARSQATAATRGFVSRGRAVAGDETEQVDTAYRTVREAWTRLLALVSLRDVRTKTPGEIRTHAVDVDGLPAPDVDTLVDVFQSVEYGGREPSDRLAHVEDALDGIERAVERREAAANGAGNAPDDGASAEDGAGGAGGAADAADATDTANESDESDESDDTGGDSPEVRA